MYNPIVNNNDDDIFDDSKSLSDISQNNVSQKANNNSKDRIKNKIDEIQLNDLSLKDLIEHIQQEFPGNYENAIANLRFQLAHTLYNSVWHWLEKTHVDRTSASVIEALNSLTENKFSLLQKIHQLQISIVKRTTINKFLLDLFIENDSLKEVQKIFNDKISNQYIVTYFHSLYQMNDFTLVQNKSLYKVLCAELDIKPNPDVLTGNILLFDLTKGAKEEMFKNAITPSIREAISSQMIKDIAEYEARKNY
jgi:hypothetical protein